MDKYRRNKVRPGFTLIEVATSLSIISVLILGLSSAVMISSHAIPTTTDTGITDQAAINVLNNLRADLREATSIRYRTAAGNAEIQLDMKDAGAAGSPARVVYNYSATDDSLSRTVDALDAVIVLAGVTAFAVTVSQDGADANVMYFLLYVSDTIQGFYEIHAALPDKPVVN